MQAAVITSDIVNSTMLTPEQSRKLTRHITEVFNGYKIEFYRGDSFQAYVKDIELALTLVLKIRAIARSFNSSNDVKSSIGIGQVKTPVRRLSTASGEAFLISGREFENMKDDNRLAINSSNSETNKFFALVAQFCDHIFRQLTQKQAAVINQLLSGHTQVQTAANLGIAQATVNQHAQSAGWTNIEILIKEYQRTATQFKSK